MHFLQTKSNISKTRIEIRRTAQLNRYGSSDKSVIGSIQEQLCTRSRDPVNKARNY